MNYKKDARTLSDLIHEHRIDDILDGETIKDIDLSEIDPNPFQPRRIFDPAKIDELGQSIKEHGIFQPIILKKVKNRHIIVSGERRFRAAQKIGLKKIPAIIRQYREAKVAEIALAENLQREDLTPIEEAEAYKVVMRDLKITQINLAAKIGKSRSHVTNTLGLLNLPKEVQKMLLENVISMGHARTLSKLKDEAKAINLANQIVEKQLSVRQIEELAKSQIKKNRINRTSKTKYFLEEKHLKEALGYKVKIYDKKIVIHCKEEIEKVIERLLKT